MYGPLGYIVANSGSLGEAFERLAEFQRLWTEAVGFDIHASRDRLTLRYWHVNALSPERRRQEHEQMLSGLLAFARSALGPEIAPIRVRFEHRAPADVSEHKRIFRAPISFAAPATEIAFSAALLKRPQHGADLVLGELIREQAAPALAERRRRDPLVNRLRTVLARAILEQREVSLAAQAAALGLGSRTLQRRLCQHGLTFRQVADEAGMGVARMMLEEPDLAIAQIAFRLGFSQTSAFHRAFRRIGGRTPGDYRRAALSAEQRH